MALAATIGSITASVSTTSTGTISPAFGAGADIGQVFNAVAGFWVSDPFVLPGDPVKASQLRWTAEVPAGATLVIETSINGGASWDVATNNRPIPRLKARTAYVRSILIRASFARPTAASASARLLTMTLRVATDASTWEWVPIGHGQIDNTRTTAVAGSSGAGATSSTGSGTSAIISKGGGQTGGGISLRIHCNDLAYPIKRNKWSQPFTIPDGTNYGDAVWLMLTNRMPSLAQGPRRWTSTTRVAPLMVFGAQPGGDPWQDAREVAAAIGYEVFFDNGGVPVFQPVPDPRVGDPVFEFSEDSVRLVAEAEREFDSKATINHYIVIGQSTSSQNAVAAEAYDNDKSSPTYVGGDYGVVTDVITLPNLTTQEDCQSAANAALYNSLGTSDQVTITVVPHWALEPGDIIKIKVSEVRADALYMIQQLATGSPVEGQQAVCSRQTTST
jgi:hypothetical protein